MFNIIHKLQRALGSMRSCCKAAAVAVLGAQATEDLRNLDHRFICPLQILRKPSMVWTGFMCFLRAQPSPGEIYNYYIIRATSRATSVLWVFHATLAGGRGGFFFKNLKRAQLSSNHGFLAKWVWLWRKQTELNCIKKLRFSIRQVIFWKEGRVIF